MASALSTTTVGTMVGRVLTKLGITKPVDQIRNKVLIQLILSQKEMYDELIANEKIKELYVVETPIAIVFINKTFLMSSLSDYQEYVALRRNGWGKVNKTDWDTLEELEKDLYARKEIYYSVYGETLKIFVGSLLSQVVTDFFLKYLRLPHALVADTDLIDIPDGYESKLVDKVVLSVGKVAPTPEPKEKE